MLNDQNRNNAFYQWLKKSIRPNDFVLDIGAGKVTLVGLAVLETAADFFIALIM